MNIYSLVYTIHDKAHLEYRCPRRRTDVLMANYNIFCLINSYFEIAYRHFCFVFI